MMKKLIIILTSLLTFGLTSVSFAEDASPKDIGPSNHCYDNSLIINNQQVNAWNMEAVEPYPQTIYWAGGTENDPPLTNETIHLRTDIYDKHTPEITGNLQVKFTTTDGKSTMLANFPYTFKNNSTSCGMSAGTVTIPEANSCYALTTTSSVNDGSAGKRNGGITYNVTITPQSCESNVKRKL